MKEAGFTFIAVWRRKRVSDKVLKGGYQKRSTVAHNQRAIDILKEGGIAPSMTFMVGNPHEDINDVLETVSFLYEIMLLLIPYLHSLSWYKIVYGLSRFHTGAI